EVRRDRIMTNSLSRYEMGGKVHSPCNLGGRRASRHFGQCGFAIWAIGRGAEVRRPEVLVVGRADFPTLRGELDATASAVPALTRRRAWPFFFVEGTYLIGLGEPPARGGRQGPPPEDYPCRNWQTPPSVTPTTTGIGRAPTARCGRRTPPSTSMRSAASGTSTRRNGWAGSCGTPGPAAWRRGCFWCPPPGPSRARCRPAASTPATTPTRC